MEKQDSKLALRHDPDLWFSDGSVVFQAESTGFRVHLSMLRAQSTVFKDLFTIPQPPDDVQELYDGVPLVKIPDLAIDVRHFFLAIFYSGFFEGPPIKTTIQVILSVTRLSHKYDVQYLFRRSMAHLATMFPTTLEDWDERVDKATFRETLFEERISTLFDILCVVEEIGALWMIPSIIYAFCNYSLDSIIENAQWSNGVSPRMQSAIIRSYDMVKAQGVLSVIECFRIAEHCSKPTVCTNAKLRLLTTEMANLGAGPLETPDYFYSQIGKECCKICSLKYEERMIAFRREIWSNLATYIDGVNEWSDLEALYKSAIAEH